VERLKGVATGNDSMSGANLTWLMSPAISVIGRDVTISGRAAGALSRWHTWAVAWLYAENDPDMG
jgi:hypothetical protein